MIFILPHWLSWRLEGPLAMALKLQPNATHHVCHRADELQCTPENYLGQGLLLGLIYWVSGRTCSFKGSRPPMTIKLSSKLWTVISHAQDAAQQRISRNNLMCAENAKQTAGGYCMLYTVYCISFPAIYFHVSVEAKFISGTVVCDCLPGNCLSEVCVYSCQTPRCLQRPL